MIPKIVRAAKGEQIDPPPVWFMRQAGRFLPQYQALRKGHTFWEVMSVVGRAAEATMQPVREFDVDAAIVFSDILVVLPGMGIEIQFDPHPSIPQFPLSRVGELEDFDPSKVSFHYEVVAEVRARLAPSKAVIGFAGGPFTLACYLTGNSRNHFADTQRLMKGEVQAFGELLKRLKDAVVRHLELQGKAGADLLMVFDSWAGVLSPASYKEFVFPLTKELFRDLRGLVDVPLIYFVNGSLHLLREIGTLDVDVLGIDHRQELDQAAALLGRRYTLQGNLDPTDLFLPKEQLKRRTMEVVQKGKGARAHIFNLGHGVLPQTPVEAVQFVVDVVRGAA